MDACATCARLADQIVPDDHDHCEMCAASLTKDKDGITVAECLWCSFVNAHYNS